MTGVALVRPASAILWELRARWADGRRVSLRLEGADLDRLEGHVTQVAATGAFVRVGGVLTPSTAILSVHWPSRLGDTDYNESGAENWSGRRRAPRVDPRQMEMPT